MPLEQQVSNRELSQRLKELGVKQESEFWWVTDDRDGHSEITHYGVTRKPSDFFHPVSAFTVAELGEMLPHYSATWKRGNSGWVARSDFPGHPSQGKDFDANTEADARAKMLIYLLENKLITV